MTRPIRRATAGASAALGLLFSAALHADDDWRKTADAEEKLENLIKVMPSTSNIMFEVSERYSHLYWAAKLGKWEFAAYQAEEIEGLLKTLQLAQPKRADTAAIFLRRAYPEIAEAAESEDWPRFEEAFANLRQECLACHAANDHGFITLPEVPPRSTSPVLHDLVVD